MEAPGCSGVIRGWKNEGSHGPAFCFHSHYFPKTTKKKGLSRLWQTGFASRVAAGIPSSSSSRPLFMYVKVPDPVPKNWLVEYSILTYFVPSVASLF
jgi:hypothetical protein